MADQGNIGSFGLARRRRLAGVAGLAIAAIALLAVTSPPTAPAKGEMGFVLTEFAPAIYQDKGDCPDGLANTVKENYLQTLSPDERKRLSRWRDACRPGAQNLADQGSRWI